MTDPITETAARALALAHYTERFGSLHSAEHIQVCAESNWQVFYEQASATIAAHKAALSTAGLVIVPREPDSDMLNAGANALDDGDTPGVMTAAEVCYAAMIAASEKEGT